MKAIVLTVCCMILAIGAQCAGPPLSAPLVQTPSALNIRLVMGHDSEGKLKLYANPLPQGLPNEEMLLNAIFDSTNLALKAEAVATGSPGPPWPSFLGADQIWNKIFDSTSGAIKINCVSGCGSASSLFTSFQLGSNTAITGSGKYVQLTAGTGITIGSQTGAGTSASPYQVPVNLAITDNATTVNGQTCAIGLTCNVNAGATSGTLAVNGAAGSPLTSYAGASTCSGAQVVQTITASGGVTCITPTGSGTVTSITFSSPLTGGTISASGTVGLGTVPASDAGMSGSCTFGSTSGWSISSGAATWGSAASCTTWYITLAANVTSNTVTALTASLVDGQTYTVVATENATGGYTMTWPSLFSTPGPPNVVPEPNATTVFSCKYDAANSICHVLPASTTGYALAATQPNPTGSAATPPAGTLRCVASSADEQLDCWDPSGNQDTTVRVQASGTAHEWVNYIPPGGVPHVTQPAISDLTATFSAPLSLSANTLSLTCAAGQVMAGASPACTATPTLGTNASVNGALTLANGGVSGVSTTLKATQATSGSPVFNLPATNGTSGFLLQTDGSGNTAWVAAPSGSFSAGGDLSGNSSNQSVIGMHFGSTDIPTTSTAPTSGQCLEYNGTGITGAACGGGGGSPGGSNTQVQFNSSSAFGGSANLTWVSPALTIGVGASATGQLVLENGGGSGAGVTVQNLGATTAYNFNLPTTPGTTGQALLSTGGGSSPMTWGNPSASAGGLSTQVQYNNGGSTLGGIADITSDGTNLTVASGGTLTNNGTINSNGGTTKNGPAGFQYTSSTFDAICDKSGDTLPAPYGSAACNQGGVGTTETYFSHGITFTLGGSTASTLDGIHAGVVIYIPLEIYNNGSTLTIRLNACSTFSSGTCNNRTTIWSTSNALGGASAVWAPEPLAFVVMAAGSNAVNVFNLARTAPVNISMYTTSLSNGSANWALWISITYNTGSATEDAVQGDMVPQWLGVN